MPPRFATAIAAACVFLSWGCRSAEHYSKRGARYYFAGHYQEASLNYRKALQKDPNLGEAYLGLGRSELKQQHFREAWQFLNRAVDLLPKNQFAKMDLGEMCLDGLIQDPKRPKNLYERLAALSDQLLAADPNSFAGFRFKGYLALIDGHMAEAVRYFERAVQISRHQPDVVISLVEALFQNQQDQEAERVARGFIESRKSHGAAYDALYVHYVNKGRLADAEQILKLKVANNPGEPGYVKQLCQFYWSHQKQAEALDLAAQLIANPHSAAQAHIASGDFYASIGHWDDALNAFQEGIRAAPAQKDLFEKKMANVLLARGSKIEAARVIDQILKDHPEDQEALRLRAGLKTESGEPAAIISAIQDYKTLLGKNSRDPKVYSGLGRAFQLRGDFPSAKAEFRQAIQLDPNDAASQLALTEIALTEHKTEDAIRWADVAIAGSASPEPRLLKALALREAGRYDEARSELNQLIQTSPQEKKAYLELGLLEIEQKNFKKAEALFTKLQALGGDLSGVSAGLAVLYSKQGQIEKAYSVLKKELEHSPDHVLVHELLASVAFQAHQYDRAINEYRAVLVLNPNDLSIHLRLAEALRLNGDFNSYVSALERARSMFPRDLLASLLLASAKESLGEEAEAIQLYRHALELQPNDPRVLNNLAYAIVDTNGNMDEALRMAQMAVQKSPDQPNFVDTLGWIYFKKNLTDSAIQLFRGLVKKYPDDPTYSYHLGAALLQKGQMSDARNALETALENRPSKSDTKRIQDLLSRTNLTSP